MDRFSALVVHLSLLALAESSELWKRFYMEDNLLFSRSDFQSPETSQVFAALEKLGGPVAEHARVLKSACARRLQEAPRLHEVLKGNVQPSKPAPSILKLAFARFAQLARRTGARDSERSNAPARPAGPARPPAPVRPIAPASPPASAPAPVAIPSAAKPGWMPGATAASHAATAAAPVDKSRARGANAAAAVALPDPQPTPDPVPAVKPKLRLVPKRKQQGTAAAASATGGWSLRWTRPGELHETHVWQHAVHGEREVPRQAFGITLGTRRERFAESYEEQVEERGLRMSGHRSRVTSLAFTADGQLLASGSRDGTLRVWDVSGGREACASLATNSRVIAMSVVPGQTCVAAVLADRRLVLWEFGPERRVTHLKAPDDSPLTALAVSRDGRWVAAGGARRRIYLWKVQRGVAAGEIALTTGRVETLAFTPDASAIACSTHKRRLELFDRESGKPHWSVRSGLGRIVSLGIPPRSKHVVGGASEGTVACWDLDNGSESQRMRPMQDRLASLAVGSEASLLLAGFMSGKAFLTKQGADRELAVFEGHPGAVSAAALAATSKHAATGSTDGTIRLWQAA